MKTETSAGGIVVCSLSNQWYVLILKDMTATWTFPKGRIEKSENPLDAALREIKEEVGFTNLKRIAQLPRIQYFYQRRGTVKKTVHYFVFESKTRLRPKPQSDEGIREAKWVTTDKAIGMIGYRQTNVTLLEKAWKLLKQQTYKC